MANFTWILDPPMVRDVEGHWKGHSITSQWHLFHSVPMTTLTKPGIDERAVCLTLYVQPLGTPILHYTVNQGRIFITVPSEYNPVAVSKVTE